MISFQLFQYLTQQLRKRRILQYLHCFLRKKEIKSKMRGHQCSNLEENLLQQQYVLPKQRMSQNCQQYDKRILELQTQIKRLLIYIKQQKTSYSIQQESYKCLLEELKQEKQRNQNYQMIFEEIRKQLTGSSIKTSFYEKHPHLRKLQKQYKIAIQVIKQLKQDIDVLRKQNCYLVSQLSNCQKFNRNSQSLRKVREESHCPGRIRSVRSKSKFIDSQQKIKLDKLAQYTANRALKLIQRSVEMTQENFYRNQRKQHRKFMNNETQKRKRLKIIRDHENQQQQVKTLKKIQKKQNELIYQMKQRQALKFNQIQKLKLQNYKLCHCHTLKSLPKMFSKQSISC